MPELSIGLMVASFVAGLFMFLAPCTLPLVPAYLAFISGVSNKDLIDPQKKERAKKQIKQNALTFVFGFSVVFISFGILAGLFGSFVGQFRDLLSQVGGAFIIIFGLMMLGWLKIPALMSEKRLVAPAALTPGKPSSSILIGSVFALGWTPCVGPVLASVLLLASTSATAWQGGFLLVFFSLGLSVPFLVTASLYTKASYVITKYSWVTKWVSLIGGLFLIFIGILLLTNNFILTVEYGYKIFNFFGITGFYNLL